MHVVYGLHGTDLHYTIGQAMPGCSAVLTAQHVAAARKAVPQATPLLLPIWGEGSIAELSSGHAVMFSCKAAITLVQKPVHHLVFAKVGCLMGMTMQGAEMVAKPPGRLQNGSVMT